MRRRSLIVFAAIAVPGCATAPERTGVAFQLPHPMSSAQDIDQFYVAPHLQPSQYETLIVTEPLFPVPIVDRELTFTPWKQDLQTSLAQALRTSGLFRHVVEGSAATITGKRTLLLESAIVEVDPGDRMVRWWFSEFGAGHSFIQVEGRIVDPEANDVLVQFADRRRGAAVFDITGGDSEGLLREDLRGIAKGFAKALTGALANR